MLVIATDSYEQSCEVIAHEILELVKRKPNACLGLATGSSPIGIYKILAAACKRGEADFSHVSTVNLDEYLGLPSNHPQSYRYFMDENLFNHINIKKENTYVPAANERAVEEFKAVLAKTPVDYQLLGVGQNGHVGFNEPATQLCCGPCIVELEESTIKANSIFFDDPAQVPRRAITMGIGDILNAARIGVIVSGKKQEAMQRLLQSEDVTTALPISFIRLHRDATVVAEKSILGR